MDKKRSLLIGAGSRRSKSVKPDGNEDWGDLVTLDIEEAHNPDILWDLNELPWPVDSNEFDEVHAYEVLEHLGRQGDVESFFAHFGEMWRILKPNGLACCTVPWWRGKWAWGDPGHTRVIQPESLIFLSQENYRQVGSSAMSDYRSHLGETDFKIEDQKVLRTQEGEPVQFAFILRALK